MTRPRFTLRTLMILVAFIGVGLYLRPGQDRPDDVPFGATKAWVYWNCGPPTHYSYPDGHWPYFSSNFASIGIDFNEDGRVEKTDRFEFFSSFSR